jgi:serine/threonine-protein kinase
VRRLSPLGTRIFLSAAASITVALGAALLLIRTVASSAADASIARALLATRSAVEDKLAARSDQLRAAAAGLAGVSTYASRVEEALRAGDRGTLLDAADEFRGQLGAAWALLTDRDGVLAAWSDHPERTGADLAGGSLIGLALQGATTQGVWIEPTPAGDSLFQVVGIPLRPPGGGSPFGVLVAALSVDSTLAETLRRNTSSEILFFVRDTLGIPTPNVSTLHGRMDLAAVLGRDSAPSAVEVDGMGDVWVGAVAPLRTAGGEAIAGVVGLRSRGGEVAPFLRLQRAVSLAFLGGLVATVLSSAWLARRITRPVASLVAATRRVGQGDLSGRVEVDSPDEIGELSRAFQRMIDELREKERLVDYLTSGGGRPAAASPPAAPAGQAQLPVLASGTVLANRYEVRGVLGSGGMGVVYRALDRELGETVALKTLRPGLAEAAPDLVERFKQEIRLARRITHRNVVRIHDLGEVNGTYFITMEYVEGTPLSQLLEKRRRLPADVTVTIGKQLGRALEVAHEAGVIHRDVKPSNLMVDGAGFLKVMDFGIARLTEGVAPERSLTQAGVVIGSPDYMAPEQLLGEPVDHRVDVYAAGCVLFECLTGRTVYQAPSVVALISRHLEQPTPEVRELVADVPAALAAVVQRAIAKDRNERWPSAAAMVEALEALT